MALRAINSLLPNDPTTQLWLTWTTDADEGTLTLDYGTSPGALNQSVAATSQPVPDGGGVYYYQALLTGLTPGTRYYSGVAGLFTPADVLPADTFAASIGAGVQVASVSDTHIELRAGTFQQPSDMDIIGAQLPDILIMQGDLVRSNITRFNATNAGWWLRFMEDYLPRASVEKLVPIFVAGGNHEYGNNSWDGITFQSGDFDLTPMEFFIPNTRAIAPTGERYGAVTVGDYLQLVALDTHATRPLDVGAWLRGGVIDPSVLLCLPFSHSPFFGAAPRSPGDPSLQKVHRDGNLRTLIEAPNVPFSICGHVHRFSRSKPLGIVETDPGAAENAPLFDLSGEPDGWVVEQAGGMIEIGQGYLGDRTPGANNLIAVDQGGQNSFNVVLLSADRVRVETKDPDGETLFARSWFYNAVTSPLHVQSGGEWVPEPVRVQSGGEWVPDAARVQIGGEWV